GGWWWSARWCSSCPLRSVRFQPYGPLLRRRAPAGSPGLCEDRPAMNAEPSPTEFHPLVGGFRDAAAYDAGRPRYGATVAALRVGRLARRPGAPVLDPGAGTGQLSVALLAAGLDLTAVEPLGPTRELLAAAIGAERVRDGRAEAIPLADGTVDA